MKKLKKIVAVILVAAIAIAGYQYFTSNKSFLLKDGTDDEKINYTIAKFEEYYNDGDFENMSKCCTGRMARDLKTQMGLFTSILNVVIKRLIPMSVDKDTMTGLWSKGTQYAQIKITVVGISYLSDSEAEAELSLKEQGKNTPTKAYMSLEKKNDMWYVSSDFYQYSKK